MGSDHEGFSAATFFLCGNKLVTDSQISNPFEVARATY